MNILKNDSASQAVVTSVIFLLMVGMLFFITNTIFTTIEQQIDIPTDDYNSESSLRANPIISTNSQVVNTPSSIIPKPNENPLGIKKYIITSLTSDKTSVVMDEEFLLQLSVVNLISSPNIKAQIILSPPSGLVITSSNFAQSGTNQFTSTYDFKSGENRNIEISAKTTHEGTYNIIGNIIVIPANSQNETEIHNLNLVVTSYNNEERKSEAITNLIVENTNTYFTFSTIASITPVIMATMLLITILIGFVGSITHERILIKHK